MQTREDRLQSFGGHMSGDVVISTVVGQHLDSEDGKAFTPVQQRLISPFCHGKLLSSVQNHPVLFGMALFVDSSLGQLKLSAGAVFLSALGAQWNLLKTNIVT